MRVCVCVNGLVRIPWTEATGWDTYSVQMPLELAREPEHSDEITILPEPFTFFKPESSRDGVAELFAGNDLDLSHSYTTHFWNEYSKSITNRISPAAIVDDSGGVVAPFTPSVKPPALTRHALFRASHHRL